jgi:hypothetical protein
MPFVLRRVPALAFLAWGVVPTALAIMGFSEGRVRPLDAAVAAFALVWWAAGIALLRGMPNATRGAFALTALPWALFVVQTARRASFFWTAGDLEAADGYGSPAAFILGVAIEQLVFVLPLTALGALLWRAGRPAEP